MRAMTRCGWGAAAMVLVLSGTRLGRRDRHLRRPRSRPRPSAMRSIIGQVAGNYRRIRPDRRLRAQRQRHDRRLRGPDGGAETFFVTGINDAGKVVGSCSSPIGYQGSSAVSRRDVHHLCRPLRGCRNNPDSIGLTLGINDLGQIVGSYYDFGYKGFIRNANGTFYVVHRRAGATRRSIPSGSTTAADHGDLSHQRRGTLRLVEPTDKFTTFLINQGFTCVNGINDLGQVVGTSGLADPPDELGGAFFRDVNGTITRFYIAGGGSEVIANEINDSGRVAGGPATQGPTGPFVFIATLDGLPDRTLPQLPSPSHPRSPWPESAGWSWSACSGWRRRRRASA